MTAPRYARKRKDGCACPSWSWRPQAFDHIVDKVYCSVHKRTIYIPAKGVRIW